MINIWPSHAGKFNAFSVISPQSSNICKFLPELRKSSVTKDIDAVQVTKAAAKSLRKIVGTDIGRMYLGHHVKQI